MTLSAGPPDDLHRRADLAGPRPAVVPHDQQRELRRAARLCCSAGDSAPRLRTRSLRRDRRPLSGGGISRRDAGHVAGDRGQGAPCRATAAAPLGAGPAPRAGLAPTAWCRVTWWRWWRRPARWRPTGWRAVWPCWSPGGSGSGSQPRVLSTYEPLTYLAADDHGRAEDFTTAWTDPTVAAVWAARGGYGAQRMVDLVDWPALRAAGRKRFVGFSDITALHTRLGRDLDQVTGPRSGARLDRPAGRRGVGRGVAGADHGTAPVRGTVLVTRTERGARGRAGSAGRGQPLPGGRRRRGGAAAGGLGDRGLRGRRRGRLPDRPDAHPAAPLPLVRPGDRCRGGGVQSGRRRRRPARRDWPRP